MCDFLQGVIHLRQIPFHQLSVFQQLLLAMLLFFAVMLIHTVSVTLSHHLMRFILVLPFEDLLLAVHQQSLQLRNLTYQSLLLAFIIKQLLLLLQHDAVMALLLVFALLLQILAPLLPEGYILFQI